MSDSTCPFCFAVVKTANLARHQKTTYCLEKRNDIEKGEFICKCGKKFMLDFDTNEVKEISPKMHSI